MRKIILTIILLLMPCTVFAAGSQWAKTSDTLVRNFGANIISQRVLVFTFTADDGTGAIPTLTIDADTWSDGTNTGFLSHGPIDGWYTFILKIDCNHAGTEPTEDSDITITQSGIDMLGGNGADLVDNTTERESLFYAASQALTNPIYDSLVVTISNNSVNSATGTITIILVP